jgi:hypothetical protein
LHLVIALDGPITGSVSIAEKYSAHIGVLTRTERQLSYGPSRKTPWISGVVGLGNYNLMILRDEEGL